MMKIREYYNQLVIQGQRSAPSYREARADLSEAIDAQLAIYTAAGV